MIHDFQEIKIKWIAPHTEYSNLRYTREKEKIGMTQGQVQRIHAGMNFSTIVLFYISRVLVSNAGTPR